tara:strand:- start:13473 stop:15944 length:2472 start_codon:yes stop_codon:yes gene_type:complete
MIKPIFVTLKLEYKSLDMRNRILPLLLSTFIITTSVYAQKCGAYEGYLQEDILKYPAFYKSLESKNIELESKHQKALLNMKNYKTQDGVKIIPVVVHVIHDLESENISDESIQGAIDILNANINGQADNFLANTPDVFAAVRGDAKIEFRLAKKDPNGNPTTGINRVRSALTSEPEPRNSVKALSYWNSYQYLNIWTVKKFAPQADGNTLLGYAQFPETGSMSTDGVVLLSSQMVSGGTLTHEVGHWLGLRHTWGDAVCGDDDVKDTPPAREPNYGVTIGDFPYHVGSFGCLADSLNWAGEMFVNYMDYTPDQYCTMFTVDQNAIMDETLDGLFNEEDSTSGIGYREYMWSQENIEKTGTADGFATPFCSQEASFFAFGSTSICQGESLLFRGSKSMFGAGNVNSFVWDFGDGNSNNSGEDFVSHTYNSVGSFDVSLTVEYNETITLTSSDPNLFPGGPATYDNILVDHMVQGTEEELVLMGANNITEIAIDSLGLYYDMVDSSYFRGYIQKEIYTATYDTTCTSSVVRVAFVSVNDIASSSAPPATSYSFENEPDLPNINDDWVLVESTDVESSWSFNAGNTTTWQWENGVGSDDSTSIKVDGDNMIIGVSTEIVSKPYNLGAFTTPAIKFSWAGASVNTFPVNELGVTYSDDCGETWRVLGTIGPVAASNAGLYSINFKPNYSEWSSIVMTNPSLKNSNIRFKFEYIVNGSANNFYLDNIIIGEQSSLMIDGSDAIASKLSIFPNPAKNNVTILLDQLSDKEVEVNLINILGAKVSELFSGKTIGNHQEINVDVGAFEKGIYFVQVIGDGDVIVTDKLLID